MNAQSRSFLFLQLSVISWWASEFLLIKMTLRLVHVIIFDKNVKKNGH